MRVAQRLNVSLAVTTCLVLGGASGPAWGQEWEPTASCPEEAVEEITRTIDFVRAQTWAAQPGSYALNLAPDIDTCRVVLHVGSLSHQEEAALRAGAGSRLAIEYRRDWARSSPVPLLLWTIFGGSAVVWTYRRYARR